MYGKRYNLNFFKSLATFAMEHFSLNDDDNDDGGRQEREIFSHASLYCSRRTRPKKSFHANFFAMAVCPGVHNIIVHNGLFSLSLSGKELVLYIDDTKCPKTPQPIRELGW